MLDSCKTYRELLADREGRGFSEQKLTNVLREILFELEALHATHQAHGHISPDAILHNSETQRSALKSPPAPAIQEPASIAGDLNDLGVTIIILLTGKSLKELQESEGLLRWQDERLVSDNFARVLNKSIARNPALRYSSAMEMLRDLDEDSKVASVPSQTGAAAHDWKGNIQQPAEASQAADSFLPGPNNLTGTLHPAVSGIARKQLSKYEHIHVAIAAALVGGILVVITGILYQRFRSESLTRSRSPASVSNQNVLPETNSSQISAGETLSTDRVQFTGISLPITNRLCTNKGNFCIYNLATLINRESGEATYSFSELHEGQQVNINGTISIANLQKESGNRIFTFAFRDDQGNTTPGWAAAGSFRLDQDSSRPGILTRFKTTESFGAKTPVGLENTAYVFPQ